MSRILSNARNHNQTVRSKDRYLKYPHLTEAQPHLEASVYTFLFTDGLGHLR